MITVTAHDPDSTVQRKLALGFVSVADALIAIGTARLTQIIQRLPEPLATCVGEALDDVPQTPRTLACDMIATCTDPVTHMDEKGFLYCQHHGVRRKETHRCRQLAAFELAAMKRNGLISYDRKRNERFRRTYGNLAKLVFCEACGKNVHVLSCIHDYDRVRAAEAELGIR